MWEIEKAVFDYQEVLFHQYCWKRMRHKPTYSRLKSKRPSLILLQIFLKAYTYTGNEFDWSMWKLKRKNLKAITGTGLQFVVWYKPNLYKDYAQSSDVEPYQEYWWSYTSWSAKIVTGKYQSMTNTKQTCTSNQRHFTIQQSKKWIDCTTRDSTSLWWWKYNQFVESSKALQHTVI